MRDPDGYVVVIASPDTRRRGPMDEIRMVLLVPTMKLQDQAAGRMEPVIDIAMGMFRK